MRTVCPSYNFHDPFDLEKHMPITDRNRPRPRSHVVIALVAIVILAAGEVYSQREPDTSGQLAIFSNTTAITLGTGAANNGSVYPSSINVSGIPSQPINAPLSIKVTINNFSHTQPDDVGIVLVGPTGAALLLQGRAGGSTDINNATYTFADGFAHLPGVWTSGTFAPSNYQLGLSFPAPGPLTNYQRPGPFEGATIAGAFSQLDPNGEWKLYVRDFTANNGGSIAGGWALEINTTTPLPSQHVLDFNGDGATDFAVVRNITGGPGGSIRWFINYAQTTTTVASDWGINGDVFTPHDFDGDNKTDIAVWREGAQGIFYILESATGTLRIAPFGQTGDDPSVTADYDGDGKADPAVYRSGTSSGAPSFWYYRGSLNNPSSNVTYVAWGQNGDFVAPGDYDGDGRGDFVVQRTDVFSFRARFWMLLTTEGQKSIPFGSPTDLIAPGDYDGDGKTDLCVVRGQSGTLVWYVSPNTTGDTSLGQVIWGQSSTDRIAPGDYDADGKTDFAVYRPSATPGQSAFWVSRTIGGPLSVPFGLNGDYPVANSNVH